VRYWLHLGLLNVEGTKMSKSLGNFLTVKDAVEKYGVALILFSIARFHYSSPINLTDLLFDEQLNQLLDLYRVLESHQETVTTSEQQFPSVENLIQAFNKAMDSDFNSSLALTTILETVKKIKTLSNEAEKNATLTKVRELLSIFLLNQKSFSYQNVAQEALNFRSKRLSLPPISLQTLETYYQERQNARMIKDFKAADTFRDLVAPYKISFMDGTENKWRFDSCA
jgi:cysteinyl-tRNA synthetase